jgi:2-dehydro-3-deoxyphosphogluconate aldolase/(4S)-4-hydroxy-2-oxoglutarate aldolase
MDLVAVGGVDVGNMNEYLHAGCVAVGLGSSVVRSDWIRDGKWDELTALAKTAVAKAKAGAMR